MSEEDVLKALRALGESDRDREAPAAVELRLRSAFRRKYKRLAWPYFAIAAAAMASFLLLLWVPKAATLKIPAVAAPAAPVVAIANPAVPKKPVPSQAAQPAEVVTEFYPLLDNPPPFERGELLRVSLPASAMRTVGLPVSEDRLDETVQADVLVGEEGLARAIRFVNTSVNRP